MRVNELNYYLETMLQSYKDVSDLNFTVGRPPQVESCGVLYPVTVDPPIHKLTPFQTEFLALKLLSGNRRLTEDLLRTGSCDSSYSLSDNRRRAQQLIRTGSTDAAYQLGNKARFRVNVFAQRGNYSIVLRKLNTKIPTLQELDMPDVFKTAAAEKTGLILVTGATGSGKSTTLAALLNEINETQSLHIITLEDPVEFVHAPIKATFNQRELGTDFNTYSNGLRAALRQSPKVILVGEMRDRLTVEIALTAAETGHLVLSTLHTIDAGQTVNRILGMFEPEEQEQVRYRLADTLRWVISQRLVPKSGGGRCSLLEVMGSNLRTRETITLGEAEGRTYYEIIEASSTFGWRTFDMSCLEAYDHNIVTEETALLYCTKRGVVSRGIDNIKKKRGESAMNFTKLHMQNPDPKKDRAQMSPTVLKLK
jgi:twitching motility protein PilT